MILINNIFFLKPGPNGYMYRSFINILRLDNISPIIPNPIADSYKVNFDDNDYIKIPNQYPDTIFITQGLSSSFLSNAGSLIILYSVILFLSLIAKFLP